MNDPLDPFGKGTPGRIALEDPAALDELRRHVIESVGESAARGILYGIGLCEGMVDGLRVSGAFAEDAGLPAFAGPPLDLLFAPEGGQLEGAFSGRLRASLEAALHVSGCGPSTAPVCWLSAGYAAGWYSALGGSDVLVLERQCRGCGAADCRFEARPLEQWQALGDPHALALLPFLDYRALRQRAERECLRPDAALDESEGSMMGAFDAMSPAVHVWGPVMVLPYSGREDSSAAVDAIEADVGRGAIRVAVVDVTGASIRDGETRGLLQLVDVLEAHEIEAVLVGLPEGSSVAGTSAPLRARDISEGIALAFQLASSGLGEPS